MKMILLCRKGFDNFTDNMIRAMHPDIETTKVVSDDARIHAKSVEKFDTVWLEWGNELAAAMTNECSGSLKGKRVILRVHAYEAFTDMCKSIDYSHVTDLVFVSKLPRDLLLKKVPAAKECRIHVIPNGIDIDRFKMVDRSTELGESQRYNIGYGGFINYKKDPMVMMHALNHIKKTMLSHQLFIAGTVQQEQYLLAMDHFVKNNDLHATWFGHVKDMARFFSMCRYVINTSLCESQCCAVMEAMATGCKPLIYSWPGATEIYHEDSLWSSLDELECIMRLGYEPARYRAWIVDNYSLALQADRTKRMLLCNDVIEWRTPMERSGFK